MAKLKIPYRPSRPLEGKLKEKEKDCLTWYAIFGKSEQECYIRFVEPQLETNPRIAKEYAKQFFSSAPAVEYIAAYREDLEVLSGGGSVLAKKKDADESDEDYQARRKRSVVEKVLSKIEELSLDIQDGDMLIDLIKAMKDTGYFDGEAQTTPPRRYLPASCNSCEYRAFCENAKRGGDIVDCCDYCKARKIAEENGFVFDKTELLDMPEEEDLNVDNT